MYSSLGRIKSSEEYARDRELTLNTLLQVSTYNDYYQYSHACVYTIVHVQMFIKKKKA